MLEFFDKYKGVFWFLGGSIAIGFALKMRNEMKRQELPRMRILPTKSKKKTYTSGKYLSGTRRKRKR